MPPDPQTGDRDTSSTQGAKAHARAQAGLVIEEMATVPAGSGATPPAGVDPVDLVWTETLRGGGYASRRLARGTRLRLTDTLGDACAHLVIYNAAQPFERLCVADTVKVMWNAYLGSGHLLLSDQGRVLGSIASDTSRHHDTMAGPSTRAQNEMRYGSGSAEGDSPAGRELLVLAAAKQGLETRDIPASIALFQGVTVAPDGELSFIGSSGPGAVVEILIELDAIVLLANAAHPLDPRETYCCTPLRIDAWRSSPTGMKDGLFSATPEGSRAFLNLFEYLAARGIA